MIFRIEVIDAKILGFLKSVSLPSDIKERFGNEV